MPDDHSEVVPLLPIPNRTVKRLSADDSADPRVKVGHRQAITARNAPPSGGAFLFMSEHSSALFMLSVLINKNPLLAPSFCRLASWTLGVAKFCKGDVLK